MNDNEYDEVSADYFSKGWFSAIREVRIQLEAGRIEDFLIEQRDAWDAEAGS